MAEKMGKIDKSDAEWARILTPEQYRIVRQKGTEAPFTGEYVDEHSSGTYKCVACGEPLFSSDAKYDSRSGWPSFYQALDPAKIEEHEDVSHGMRRIEVTCARCGAHLGHLFPDGPAPTGLRYCVNSASLTLEKKA